MTDLIPDTELRTNHEFVMTFESLRKRYGYRELHDTALRALADSTGIAFEELRIARHLRNALAHGETVNRKALAHHLQLLSGEFGRGEDLSNASLPATSPATSSAYRVHAWQDPRLEQEMLANGFVSVGGAEIGDLSDVHDAELIRRWLTESMSERSSRAINLFVGYWRRFLWDAEIGSIVVLPTRSRRVAIGEFSGPYHYVAEAEPRARHRRNVAWLNLGVDRDAFGDDLITTLNGQHTVQTFAAREAAARIRSIATVGIDPAV